MNAKVHHRWLQEYRHTQCWSSLASSEHYLNRSTWAPNTPAYLCDHHATQGLKITVSLVPTATHEIETQVRGLRKITWTTHGFDCWFLGRIV